MELIKLLKVVALISILLFFSCGNNIDNEVKVLILNDFNFKESKFIIYLINDPEINKTKSNFKGYYTKDINLMSKIKKKWELSIDSSVHRCGYDLILYISKNDTICKKILINTLCDNLIIDNESYAFNDKQLLYPYLRDFKTIYKSNKSFENNHERKEYIRTINKSKICLKELCNAESLFHSNLDRFLFYVPYNQIKTPVLLKIEDSIKSLNKDKSFFIYNEYSFFNEDKTKGIFLIDLYYNGEIVNPFRKNKITDSIENKFPIKLTYYTSAVSQFY